MSGAVTEKEFIWKFRDEITQGVKKARQAMQEAVTSAKEAGMKVSDTGGNWKKMGTDAKESTQETSQSLDSMKDKILSYQHAATDASKNIREQLSESKQVLNGIPKQKIVSVKAQIDSNKLKSFEEQLQGLPPHKRILLNLKGNYYSQLEKAKRKAEETKHSFSELKGTMAGTFLGGAALGGIYAIGNGLKNAAAAGMEFDTEQQKMLATWKTLTGSASSAKGMVDTINDLSIKTGQATDTINELEQGFYHLHSSKSEADQMTTAMLNMGDAVGLSGQQLTQVEQDMVHGLATGKVTQGELNQIGMYFPMIDEQMAKHFHTTVKGMREMASAGKITGKDLEEVFEKMGNSGKYKHAVENMMQTTWGSMRTIKSMVPRLVGSMEEGLFKARNPLVGAIAKWTTDPATKKGFENFGKGISDVFAGLGSIIVNLVKPFEGLNRIVGSVLKQFASGVWIGMKASFETMGAAVKFTSDMLSGLFGWVGKILGAIGKLTGLSSMFHGAGIAVKGLGAAFGVVLGPALALKTVSLGVKGALLAFKSTQTIIKGVGTAIETVTNITKTWRAATKAMSEAQTVLDIALNANVISLVVIAITALVAGLVLAYKKIRPFRDAVNRLGNSLKRFFTGKSSWNKAISKQFKDLNKAFARDGKAFQKKFQKWNKDLWNGLTGNAKWEKSIGKAFKRLGKEYDQYSKKQLKDEQRQQKRQQKEWNKFWNSFSKKSKQTWNDLKKYSSRGMENIRKTIAKRSRNISKTWNTSWSAIKQFSSRTWNNLKKHSSDGMNNIQRFISRGMNVVNRIWSSGWNTFANFFKSIWNGIKQAAQDGMNGVISVIDAGIGAVNKVWSFFTGHGTGIGKLGKVHFAQGGTVHRHLSVINDGNGPDWKELVQTPDGQFFMSQERNWTGFLPEGSRVYNGQETRELMNMAGIDHYATGGIVGASHYAGGGVVGKAMDWAEGAFENVTSWLGDKFEAMIRFLEHPLEATKDLLQKATSGMYKGLGNFAQLGHGAMDKLTKPIADWFKRELDKLIAAMENGGVSSDLIRLAAAKMHVKVSSADIAHIMNVIQHESGGRAGAVNNWDSNAAKGTPSKGILQFIEPTFLHYAMPGYGDIMRPFDQLLAMFNDTTWRSDLTLGGWGPTGARRYATGGEVFGLTNAIIGDNPEHHEFVLNPYATSAEPLLDKAFEATAQAQPAGDSNGGNSKLDRMISLLEQLLTSVNGIDTDVYLDGEKITDNSNKRNAKDLARMKR